MEDDLLRVRATGARVARSRQFLARCNDEEAGYLSFDHRADIDTGVVYDLFVLPQFRERGIGSQLVVFAEDLARALHCSRTRLSPRAFDASVDQTWLEAWYAKKGYCLATDGTQELEKRIAVP